jgi:branched-chain amino acid transport system permease protein
MSELLGVIVNGVALGAVYALVAVGFVIVFRSTDVFNFAHGYAMVFAAYLATTLLTSLTSLPFLVVILLVLAIVATLGGLIFLLTLRPLLGESLWAPAMVTVGLTVVAQAIVGIVWSNEPRQLHLPWQSSAVHIPGTDVSLSTYTLGTIALTALFFAVVSAFFRYAALGQQMRAAAENPRLASWAGINVTRIFVIAWAIAGVAASLAGIALGANSVVSADLSQVGMRAIPAAMLGGLDSVPGALLGSLVVGIAEVGAANYLGSTTRDVATFGVMLVVILMRPAGLLGSVQVRRV